MGFVALFGAIFGSLTIGIALMLRGVRRTDERRKGIRDLAAEWGFEFSALMQESNLPFAHLRFFTETALGSEVTHVMRSDDVWVADVFRSDGSGTDASLDRHTVVAYKMVRGPHPTFRATPEGALERLFHRLGAADIDFDDDPDFSRAFELKGSPTDDVRRLFAPSVRRAMMELPRGVWVDGGTDWLLVCSPGRTPVDLIPDQVAATRALGSAIESALSIPGPPDVPAGTRGETMLE